MSWKYNDHIQGTNVSEFECEQCGNHLYLPETPDAKFPACENCGAAEQSVKRIGLLARISEWIGTIANR